MEAIRQTKVGESLELEVIKSEVSNNWDSAASTSHNVTVVVEPGQPKIRDIANPFSVIPERIGIVSDLSGGVSQELVLSPELRKYAAYPGYGSLQGNGISMQNVNSGAYGQTRTPIPAQYGQQPYASVPNAQSFPTNLHQHPAAQGFATDSSHNQVLQGVTAPQAAVNDVLPSLLSPLFDSLQSVHRQISLVQEQLSLTTEVTSQIHDWTQKTASAESTAGTESSGSELGRALFSPIPQKPTREIRFELGQGGTALARYHAFVVEDTFIVLVYDNRFEYGHQYLPPVSSDVSGHFYVSEGLPGRYDATRYAFVSLGVQFTLDHLDFCILYRKPDSDIEADNHDLGEELG